MTKIDKPYKRINPKYDLVTVPTGQQRVFISRGRDDSKINVLLINPEDIKAYRRFSEFSPFAGLAYLASYLDYRFGDSVRIRIIEMLPEKMTLDALVEIAQNERFHVVGITSKTYNYFFAEKVAKAIKLVSPKSLILFGGSHATALPRQVVMNDYCDMVVPSEGEVVVAELIYNLLSSSDPFDSITGAYYKRDGEVIEATSRPIISNLDELPFPEWSKYYDLNLYDRHYDDDTGKFHLMIPIFASRSCPYVCHFCQPVLTRKYRTRSVDNVLDEVEELVDRYRINRLYFEDSIFGVKKNWFMSFCNEWDARGLVGKVEWGFETNVNCVDYEQLKSASDAGCFHIYFGMESASDQVLTRIGKGATKKKLSTAISDAKKAGIGEVCGSFIFGMPYETSETAKETLDFMEESMLDSININLLDVYPGTDLYAMVNNGIGGIRWIPEKKDQWDACGRTNVKTLVNDLDSIEKLESLMVQARAILHRKYRRNWYNYMRKAIKYFIFYSFHNRARLTDVVKRTISAYVR